MHSPLACSFSTEILPCVTEGLNVQKINSRLNFVRNVKGLSLNAITIFVHFTVKSNTKYQILSETKCTIHIPRYEQCYINIKDSFSTYMSLKKEETLEVSLLQIQCITSQS